jgi:ribosomal protein S18 acetylase RimI-like enzyme
MDVRFVPITEFGLAPAAELLTRAFADYFVTIVFSEDGLRRTVQLDTVDFGLSPVLLVGGEPVGAALIARRGAVSRLAGMAIVPKARKRGAGRALMEHLLEAARARTDRRMILEVIEQNTAAVRLYEAMGFSSVRRLVGFAGAPPEGLKEETALVPASLPDVAAAAARMDPEIGWPWQLSAETLAQLPPPAVGYTLDESWVGVMNPAGPVVGLRGFAVDGVGRREERAGRLLHAVMAKHPAKEWRFSAIWPEELAGWFTRAGLARTELSQWQMVRKLG